MRRSGIVVAVTVPLVLSVAVAAPAAGSDTPSPTAARPVSWTNVTTPPMSGDTLIADMTSDAAGTVWATGTQSTATTDRAFLLYGSATTWTRQLRPAPPAGTYEQASGVAVTPSGITIVGETNYNVNQRKPFAATRLSVNRWQTVSIQAPDSVSWMAAVDGSADGPVIAMGQYLGARADIVGFASHP